MSANNVPNGFTLFVEQEIDGDKVKFGVPLVSPSHTHATDSITDFEERISEIVQNGEITVVGKSAYESWLEQPGNAGKSEAEFVASLKGGIGDPGEPGPKGEDGDPGESAFETWLELPGNEGKTEADFLASLKGEPGQGGDSLDSLPVGYQGVMAWTDDIVTQTNGAVWLKCDGRSFDSDNYPDLLGKNGIVYGSVRAGQNMTSNTTPAPQIVTASSEYGGVNEAWRAMDGYKEPQDGESLWAASGSYGEWWQIDFGETKTINRLEMTGRADPHSVMSPASFALQGSVDGSEWEEVTRQNGLSWVSNETKTFQFPSSSYRYWRLSDISTYGQVVCIAELVFYSPDFTTAALPDIVADGNGQYTYIKAKR